MEEYRFEAVHDHMHVTNESSGLLLNISKWAKFLAILGFVSLALGIISLLFSGISMSRMPSYADATGIYTYMPGVFSWGFIITYMIFLLIMFIPIYMLYKFADEAKKAVDENSTETLTRSFRYLSTYYKIIGIITIVVIAFAILGAIIGAFAMM